MKELFFTYNSYFSKSATFRILDTIHTKYLKNISGMFTYGQIGQLPVTLLDYPLIYVILPFQS